MDGRYREQEKREREERDAPVVQRGSRDLGEVGAEPQRQQRLGEHIQHHEREGPGKVAYRHWQKPDYQAQDRAQETAIQIVRKAQVALSRSRAVEVRATSNVVSQESKCFRVPHENICLLKDAQRVFCPLAWRAGITPASTLARSTL